MNLPSYIEKQLQQPPPVPPGRHDAMRNLALQMVGESIPDEEAFIILRQWCPDTDKTDKEIRDLIRGAHARNPQPASTGEGWVERPLTYTRLEQPKLKPADIPITSEELPTVLAGTDPSEFLGKIYSPEDIICVSWEGTDEKPSRNIIHTVKDWVGYYEAHPEEFSGEHGVWYCINPLNNLEKRGNEYVADYRYCLIEGDAPLDKIDETLPKMFGWFKASNFPIAATYKSGHRSIHALVRIDAASATEFKERVDKIYAYCVKFPYLDKERTAAAQLSRLPGAFREEHQQLQSLLTWGMGAATYEEWEESQTPTGRAVAGILGSVCSISQFRKMKVTPKKKIIGDWFREGDIGFTFAVRGVGKTWFAFDMGEAIARRKTFGPWEVHMNCPVLYVDGEVASDHMQSRSNALDLSSSEFEYLNHEILFQRFQDVVNIADQVWQEAIIRVCEQKGIKVVILDNLSCLSPNVDENDGLSWSAQLLNWTLSLRRRGIAVLFIQHAGRSADNMRGHSRREDPANWIIRLDKIEHDGPEIGARFKTVFRKNRNAAQRPEDYDFWYRPEGNQTKLTFTKVSKDDHLLEILRRKGHQPSQKEMAEEMHVDPSTVHRMLDRLEAQGQVEWDEKGRRWRAN